MSMPFYSFISETGGPAFITKNSFIIHVIKIYKKVVMMSKAMLCKLFVFFCVIGGLQSCVNTKNSTYFVGQGDAVLNSTTISPETTITPNDLIGITVSSLNPNATAIFNTTSNGSQQGTSYLVNKDGNIQFPILGNIRAQGLTTNQLRENIIGSILDKKLLVDPIVSVRFLNFKVTVLGEVQRPTVVDVPDEKISLLEALGLAGDITIYGKRDNVMVIREENNQKIIKRLNLNSSEIFNSPYYYLKANDIVYVEANKARIATSTRTTQLLPIFLTALSFIAIMLDRILF
jgi:polysaccharide export outer membrane protein